MARQKNPQMADKILLCPGNSARSQMAEGLVNHLRHGEWRAVSAGTQPADAVHPLVVRAMAEMGIDISGQQPKHVTRFRDADLDLVVTLCDDTARPCPNHRGQGHLVHVGFPDPAAASGSEAERLERFRQIRDGLGVRVTHRLEQLVESEEEIEET